MGSFSVWHWLIILVLVLPSVLYLLTLQRALRRSTQTCAPCRPAWCGCC